MCVLAAFVRVIFATEAHIVGLPEAVWGSGYVWLVMLLSVTAALLPDFLLRAYTDSFDPLYRRKREAKVRAPAALLIYRIRTATNVCAFNFC